MNTPLKLLMAWLAAASVMIGGGTVAAQPQTLEIGEPAPDFELKGVDGEMHTLDSYADAEVLAVIFNTNHCPTAQAYESRIKQLAADYQGQGVAVVVIQPNDPEAVRLDELGYSDLNDTFEEIQIRAEDRDFNFPYLYDGDTQEVAQAYGPLVTPHVFIFDASRTLRYEGRIDDGENPADITSHDTRNAIDALLNGQEVPTETTNVFGCSVKWADKREQAEASLAQWNQETATLEEIDVAGVEALAGNDADVTRVINVWATWCAPCVAELSELVEMHRMYRHRGRLEIVTIAMDDLEQQDRALEILNERHASMTNYIFAGENRDELVQALDEQWRGPVPYTLIVAPDGEVLYRHTGPFDPHDVKKTIVDQIGRTYFD